MSNIINILKATKQAVVDATNVRDVERLYALGKKIAHMKKERYTDAYILSVVREEFCITTYARTRGKRNMFALSMRKEEV